MKHFTDIHRQAAPTYAVGDKVWLDASNLRTSQPSKKLEDRSLGPFIIPKVVSPTAYKLELPKTWKVHTVFHTSRLHPYIADPSVRPEQAPPPPPMILDEE